MVLLLNRVLATALRNGDLDFLDQRVLRIEVVDLALDHRLSLCDRRLFAAPIRRPVDVRFGGKARDFLLLALGDEDPDSLFFQRRLQLEGDTELGLEIKNFLYAMEGELLPASLQRLTRRMLAAWPADYAEVMPASPRQ